MLVWPLCFFESFSLCSDFIWKCLPSLAMNSSTCSTPTSHSSSPSYSQPPSSSSSLCTVFHCCCKIKGAHLWSFHSAYILIEVLTINHWDVWPGGTCNWPISSCSIILNGSVLKWQTWLYVRLLCLMQRTVFSAFKKWHFEMQNVCKAENVFRPLETCSLCVRLNNCAVHVILVC